MTISDYQLEQWTHLSRRDNWHMAFVGSDIREMLSEIERLKTENWQLRQACGYPIPADKETINNPFKCGICDARNRELSQPTPDPAA